MSALALAVIGQLATACHAPAWMVQRIQATAAVESHGEPYAIHDNGSGMSFHPSTSEEAIAIATALSERRRNYDAGILQINVSNFARTGLTIATAFDPQANICAGVQITAEAERAASCIYNTGRAACSNGYPERIFAAMEPSLHSIAAVVPAPSAVVPCPASDGWHVTAACAPDAVGWRTSGNPNPKDPHD